MSEITYDCYQTPVGKASEQRNLLTDLGDSCRPHSKGCSPKEISENLIRFCDEHPIESLLAVSFTAVSLEAFSLLRAPASCRTAAGIFKTGEQLTASAAGEGTLFSGCRKIPFWEKQTELRLQGNQNPSTLRLIEPTENSMPVQKWSAKLEDGTLYKRNAKYTEITKPNGTQLISSTDGFRAMMTPGGSSLFIYQDGRRLMYLENYRSYFQMEAGSKQWMNLCADLDKEVIQVPVNMKVPFSQRDPIQYEMDKILPKLWVHTPM